jgi:hypothetical protein
MKKILLGLAAVACLASFVTPAFAGEGEETKKEKPAKKAKKAKKEGGEAKKGEEKKAE